MLAYTVFIFSRFSYRYYLARRQSGALVPDSTLAFQRSQRTLVADLSRGVRTLKAIASTAPLLGLAGTCNGILGGFRGIGMQKDSALAMMSADISSALIATAAGLLVAIPAAVSYNIVRMRMEVLASDWSNMLLAAIGDQHFQLAQKLPLQKQFSSPPAFALIVAPALAVLVAILMLFQSYETPTGLWVRLLVIGSLDSDHLSSKPVVITAVGASAKGSAMIRVNGRQIPLGNMNQGVDRKPEVPTQWTAYVEGETTLSWGDVVNVIDVAQGLHADVVLLTTTPDKNYTYTQRSAKPTK